MHHKPAGHSPPNHPLQQFFSPEAEIRWRKPGRDYGTWHMTLDTCQKEFGLRTAIARVSPGHWYNIGNLLLLVQQATRQPMPK